LKSNFNKYTHSILSRLNIILKRLSIFLDINFKKAPYVIPKANVNHRIDKVTKNIRMRLKNYDIFQMLNILLVNSKKIKDLAI